MWICSSAGFRQVFPSTVRLVGYADRQICGPVVVEVEPGGGRGYGRWGLVSPVPGCGTRREEDSLLTRCGDDQSGRACFLGKLCWFFVSVEASVFVVDLCALCPLLGVYFGTGGMDLSKVNTTAFSFSFHARRRRHYWRVGCCLRLCIFKYKFITFLLSYFTLLYTPELCQTAVCTDTNIRSVHTDCSTDVQPILFVDFVLSSFFRKAMAPSMLCCFCPKSVSVDNNQPDVIACS